MADLLELTRKARRNWFLWARLLCFLLLLGLPIRGWAADEDSDGDGLFDALEDLLGTDPNLADSDTDGIDDFIETDGGLHVPAPDSDNDGDIDARDKDSDNDDVWDENEGADDSDNDGIGDWRDPCPFGKRA